MVAHKAQVEMILQNHLNRHGQARAARGMTLIEVIGVLAVLAILAAIVLPALIKQTDTVVANQEIVTLQSFGNALQQNAARNRRIPGVAGYDWATNIAAELGLNTADVTNNIRRAPRLILVDTNGFGSLYPPSYAQSGGGTLVPANSSFNPRLMIVSSLGVNLPPSLVNANGLISTSDFTNLWNWNPTTGGFPTTGVWNGWTGNPNDIIVQRVNLSQLFVSLWLSYTPPNTWSASYQIDTNALVNVAGTNHAYYIQGSRLSLYYTDTNLNTTLDSVQILNQSSSFAFNYNKWALGLATGGGGGGGGSGSGGSGTNGIGRFDFADMVNGFLSSPGPTATATYLTNSPQQTNVVQSFVNYMQDYTNWANSNFTNNSLYNQAVTDQSTLMSNVNKLISTIVVH